MSLNDFYEAFHKRFEVKEMPKPKRFWSWVRWPFVMVAVLATGGCSFIIKYLTSFGFGF